MPALKPVSYIRNLNVRINFYLIVLNDPYIGSLGNKTKEILLNSQVFLSIGSFFYTVDERIDPF